VKKLAFKRKQAKLAIREVDIARPASCAKINIYFHNSNELHGVTVTQKKE